jgi:polyhydroxyalkanoate synthase subunit PhaC
MTTTTYPAVNDAVSVPLDELLIDAAVGPLRRFTPGLPSARLAARLAANPSAVSRRLTTLGVELTRIGGGSSDVAPAPKDRRFADSGWSRNALLRRLMQAYLATGRTVAGLIDDAQLDWRDEQRLRFLVENIVEALSPSNVPLLNPASAKEVIDTLGLSLVRGGYSLVRDVARAPRIPAMVDTSAFRVGHNIAATAGAVVLRTDVFELIQYAPQTPTVREVPLLLVPPMINKYYALDLAPGRSWIEHLVQNGQQVFVMSWRNPDARHADWGLDTYVRATITALDVVARICRTRKAALAGVCAGGVVASLTTAHLAATGRSERLVGLGLAVTLLDQRQAGMPAALVDQRLAAAAVARSRRRGYLDGRTLAEMFAWLRPGDLVWHYWVNNYLMGRRPAAFDILFWNTDTTRMSARLHADFVDIAVENRLASTTHPLVLGLPADLASVRTDAYVVAGAADHITPWQNCYRTVALLGGQSRFVLSGSGHIAAIVNPPSTPNATYRLNTQNPSDPQTWLTDAETQHGSWWPDFSAWLGSRCGRDKKAPGRPGNREYPPLVDAPGTYVFHA